eukprot:NODE_258_length_12622_cov_0.213767.p1 type:complete len:1687 gc:universal NODE_258_length_12622_cov_0.213767:11335-6275(-)
MKHTINSQNVQISGSGSGIIEEQTVNCPTQKQTPQFTEEAKYNPKTLPYFINGPFPLNILFPHFKNQYHTLDDVYVLHGQFESHRFHNKELYLPAKAKPSTSEDELFHGYTVQSFLTFIHDLSDFAFKLVLLPSLDNQPETDQNPPEQGLVSSSNVIFLTWPDTVESMTAFLMGICWHIAGLTFGYYIRCPLARNPYSKDYSKPYPLIEYQLNHLWVTVGLRGYLYIKLLKHVFGPSFVQFYVYKTILMLTRIESQHTVPSIAEFYIKRISGNVVTNNLNAITAHNYYVSKCALIMNGLGKCVGEQAMDAFISQLTKKCNKMDNYGNEKPETSNDVDSNVSAVPLTSNNDILYIHTLNTNEFINKLKKQTTFNFQSYIKQYIFYPGLPILNITWVYNKRKSCVEIDVSQSKTIPGGPVFTGSLAIKIQESDGSYEHVLDIQKQSQQFDIRYNTRYKRVKRFRNAEMEDVMFHRDINGIVVAEYTKPEDEAMEYIQVDCDHLWIGNINVKQSEYMVAQMVLKELDMNTQMQGISQLQQSKEPCAATTLFRIICNHRYHPFIRSEAAYALSDHHVIGMYYLLQYVKRFWCENDNVDPFNSPHSILTRPLFIHNLEIGVKLDLEVKQPGLYKYLFFTPLVLKSNDFSHFGQYQVATSAIQALSKIRIPQTTITIPSIRESSLGMTSSISQRLMQSQIQQSTQQLGQLNNTPSTVIQQQHQQLQQYHQQMNQQTMQVLDLPQMVQGVAPPLIRKLTIDLLKCADNSNNQFNDDDYMALLINSVHHAFIPTLNEVKESTDINEEIIGNQDSHSNHMEIISNCKLAYTNSGINTNTIHATGIDHLLFKKAVFLVESCRIHHKQPKTLVQCIAFISHCMLMDFIPIDIQRILPYTINNHHLVKLQAFESLLLLNTLENSTFMTYYFNSICSTDLQTGLIQMLLQYCLLSSNTPTTNQKVLVTINNNITEILPYIEDRLNKLHLIAIQQIIEPSSELMEPVKKYLKLKVKSTLYNKHQDSSIKKGHELLSLVKRTPVMLSKINNENDMKLLYSMLQESSLDLSQFVSLIREYYNKYSEHYKDTGDYKDVLQSWEEFELSVGTNELELIKTLFANTTDFKVIKDVTGRLNEFTMTDLLKKLGIEQLDSPNLADSIVDEVVSDTVSAPVVNTILIVIWNALNDHPSSFNFRHPIDPHALGIPDYFDVIKTPMDLNTIKDNVMNTEYTVLMFLNDVVLMLQNCITFNSSVSQVVKDAYTLYSHFKRTWVIYYPNISIPALREPITMPKSVEDSNSKMAPENIVPSATDSKAVPSKESMVNSTQECSIDPSKYSLNYPLHMQVSKSKLKSLITSIKRRQQAWPFVTPVDPIAMNIPSYTAVIKNPMDLSTISLNINSNSHYTLSDVASDLELMIKNCLIFNPPDNAIHLAGLEIRNIIQAELNKIASTQDTANSVVASAHDTAPSLVASVQENVATLVSSTLAPTILNQYIGQVECSILESFATKIFSRKNSIPFIEPVDAVKLNIPQYYTIIDSPMDFKTLMAMTKNGEIGDIKLWLNKVDLIFENCYKFNKPDHSVSLMGKQLQQWIHKEFNNIAGKIERALNKMREKNYTEEFKQVIYSTVSGQGNELLYEAISNDYNSVQEARDSIFNSCTDRKLFMIMDMEINRMTVEPTKKRKADASSGKRKKNKSDTKLNK